MQGILDILIAVLAILLKCIVFSLIYALVGLGPTESLLIFLTFQLPCFVR